MNAPIPDYEEERLTALHKCKILDTEPEAAFDDFTKLASFICNVPISLVSIVDKERQWFKSSVGVDISETSRAISFCGHAILKPELFIVPDAAKDKRFENNPLVTTKPQIRFYAGAPFYSADGLPLGTLCVIDRKPRKLNESQLEALNALSRQVGAQLQLRANLIELKEAINTIKIVSGILPICSSCKKIRDDNGDWESLDQFMYENSEAKLSHGMCPGCIERLYPEYT